MKHITIPVVVAGLLGHSALAGTHVSPISTPSAGRAAPDAFSDIRRPITNPTLFDLALPSTNLHPIFAYHRLPKQVDLANGTQVDLGGDVQLYALQFEYALNDVFSIVATKDGYIRSSPNNTLNSTNGWANLGGGVKYAFWRDEVTRTALSTSLTFEFPTGNSDVFQGEGKGLANLIINGLKMYDAWQFAGSVGMQIPFSNDQTTSSFISAHASYEVSPWFIPLVEVNWFRAWSPGDGTGNFPTHLGGALPAVLAFEGGDLFNLGSVNAGQNRDLVTAAVGFRSRIHPSAELGIAYEMPLTSDNASLIRDRLTVDLVWRF